MALLVRSTGDSSAAGYEARRIPQNLDQDLPLTRGTECSTKSHRARSMVSPTLRQHCSLGFAIIALVMASVGIYAVIAQATSRRTQEIGVRIAHLGATTRQHPRSGNDAAGLKQLLIGPRSSAWQSTIPAARAMAALRLSVPQRTTRSCSASSACCLRPWDYSHAGCQRARQPHSIQSKPSGTSSQRNFPLS